MVDDDTPIITARQYRESIAWHERLNKQFTMIIALGGLIIGLTASPLLAWLTGHCP